MSDPYIDPTRPNMHGQACLYVYTKQSTLEKYDQYVGSSTIDM